MSGTEVDTYLHGVSLLEDARLLDDRHVDAEHQRGINEMTLCTISTGLREGEWGWTTSSSICKRESKEWENDIICSLLTSMGHPFTKLVVVYIVDSTPSSSFCSSTGK
uniref:Uncharacterized protein n=1 Tax=Pristionchus pacificus TaxID=54126 RepID=A0A2A6CUZ8_PRIPA|eukprot:PDM81851.1 hypothetical protein PRIPAC_34005 [Pristionchus pacificus]